METSRGSASIFSSIDILLGRSDDRTILVKPLNACPVCGSRRAPTVRRWTVRRGPDPIWNLCLEVFRVPEMRHAVRLCRACGCLFRDPVWDDAELELIYSPEVWRLVEPYRPNTPEARANNHERRQRMAERILAEVPADGAARAIGDVGGRDGFYVAPFLDHGWSATVIDPADAPVVDTRIVRDPVTLARHAGPPAFDALVLSHVLEHVVDLAGFLGDVRRVLRPGGLVYTEVPYEVRRVLLRADLGDPSHQIYFATRTLRHLFEVAGFAVRRCARERTTYDEARIFAIVIIAEPDGRSAGRPLPPGAFHVLAEMLSSARAALAHASS